MLWRQLWGFYTEGNPRVYMRRWHNLCHSRGLDLVRDLDGRKGSDENIGLLTFRSIFLQVAKHHFYEVFWKDANLMNDHQWII